MLTISPISRALVPVDSASAQALIGPNYDEFQSDEEIWQYLQAHPQSILRATMAHCAVPTAEQIGEDGSLEALAHAQQTLVEIRNSSLTTTVENALFLYEIVDPKRPGVRQIGLGGSAKTGEIKTEDNPAGTIIRNEGIRPTKAAGRAQLIEHTGAYIGVVNNTVEDRENSFALNLEKLADSRDADFSATDEHGNTHSVWLIADPAEVQILQAALNSQGEAYVADGNHRSAAAAQLGREEFLAIFFPASRMGLAPYNRLIKVPEVPEAQLLAQLSEYFEVRPLGDIAEYAPTETHTLGLYYGNNWIELQVRDELLSQADAAGRIDAAIVQTYIFSELFGITDAADQRFNYVGGNKDSVYLKQQVDRGAYTYAVSMTPVTMEQFIAVCRAQQFMPPKSTWFEPKLRSGLFVYTLED